ncbi:hypothetical protein MMC22_004013 [Lobaria immixta]|nr:hypothetical protein [Lobaria immixta]
MSRSSPASAAINNILYPPDGQQPHSFDQATSISTHNAIVDLIWRSIMLVSHRAGILSARETTYFSQAVDCSTRLHLPKPYFGKALYRVKASLALCHLASATDSFDASNISELQTAARAMRAEISDATAAVLATVLIVGFQRQTNYLGANYRLSS